MSPTQMLYVQIGLLALLVASVIGLIMVMRNKPQQRGERERSNYVPPARTSYGSRRAHFPVDNTKRPEHRLEVRS